MKLLLLMPISILTCILEHQRRPAHPQEPGSRRSHCHKSEPQTRRCGSRGRSRYGELDREDIGEGEEGHRRRVGSPNGGGGDEESAGEAGAEAIGGSAWGCDQDRVAAF